MGVCNMLSKFERPQGSAEYGRNLEEYIIKMSKALDELSTGAADLKQAKELIYSLIKEQDENGFWALISNPSGDGAIRILYWYEPTYIATAIMMYYYMQHKNETLTIEGFNIAFEKGLEASTGRGLKGHGYDDIKGRLNALQIFSKGKVLCFVANYSEICPEFSKMITDITNWLENAINTKNTKGDWGEDYKNDMVKTLKLLTVGNEEIQPWGKLRKSDYIWYASYGANLLYERFTKYIKGGVCKYNGVSYVGCRDKSLPINSRPINIPYKMYYGNKSSSWGHAGVSFLDIERTGQTLGRMYLITREQLEDISRQEGRGENWYNKSVVLGEHEGIEIVTITNKSKRSSFKPSDQYLEVIRRGLKDTYPELSDFDVMKYLVDCGQ